MVILKKKDSADSAPGLHVGDLCLRSYELVQRGIWWLEPKDGILFKTD